MNCQCPFLSVVSLCALSFPQGFADESSIDVSNHRELFIDHYLIDTLDGASLELHEPQLQGTVLDFDRPYEGQFSGYVTILHDTDATLYRMYYRGLPEAGGDISNAEVTCYAESQDGIEWRKPELGLFDARGLKNTNIVLANLAPFSHNFSPFRDTNPACNPAERYKALAGSHATGLHVFVSPDGVHWRKRDDTPIITAGAFDSQNVAFWSELEQTYVCYFRTWSEGEWAGFRTISRCTSPDFITWSKPQPMTFGDTPMEHLYTNQTHPYVRAPQIYIAVPMRFLPGRRVLTAEEAAGLGVYADPAKPNLGYASDCADAVLMTSRGGTRYDRTFMEAFIRPGADLGNWASRAGLTALGVMWTGDVLSIYKQAHYAQPSAHLVRYTLRLDGFASLHGPYKGGSMTSKPLHLGSAVLFANFSTSAAGEIRVELQAEDRSPIQGYTLADTDPLIGDRLDHPVTWRGNAILPRLSQLRLHITLKDADLFSLRTAPRAP